MSEAIGLNPRRRLTFCLWRRRLRQREDDWCHRRRRQGFIASAWDEGEGEGEGAPGLVARLTRCQYPLGCVGYRSVDAIIWGVCCSRWRQACGVLDVDDLSDSGSDASSRRRRVRRDKGGRSPGRSRLRPNFGQIGQKHLGTVRRSRENAPMAEY